MCLYLFQNSGHPYARASIGDPGTFKFPSLMPDALDDYGGLVYSQCIGFKPPDLRSNGIENSVCEAIIGLRLQYHLALTIQVGFAFPPELLHANGRILLFGDGQTLAPSSTRVFGSLQLRLPRAAVMFEFAWSEWIAEDRDNERTKHCLS